MPMNPQQTVEKMQAMRMKTMAGLYHQAVSENAYSDMGFDEFMAMLIDHEWEARQQRRITNLISKAGLKASASPHDIDYTSRRGLDKKQFQRLLSLQFVKNGESLIITGSTGVGKSYLAQALGYQACHMLMKTRYFVTARLFDQAKLARVEGGWLKLLKQLRKTDLLILDDFGLHHMDQNDRQCLLDLIEERHEQASTIICSQIPVSGWHQIIGEDTVADAILDRITHSSHRIELEGESLRKQKTLNN